MSSASLASQFHNTLWLIPASTHIARADLPSEMPAQIASSNSGVFIVGAPLFLLDDVVFARLPAVFADDSRSLMIQVQFFQRHAVASLDRCKQFDLACPSFLYLGT